MSEQQASQEYALDSALYSSSNAVEQLISELASTSGSGASKLVAAKIQDQMSNIRARIRDLEELAEEQDITDETDRLVSKVSSYKRAYEALQVSLRRANLQRRKNAELAAADERRALLGTADPLQRQRKLESEADLSAAAEDITASLQRTRQQMIEELDHTSATLAAMDMSDKTLKAAKDEFAGQKTSFRRSHRLLGTMRRHSLLDTLTLWGGMAFFTLVVAYIVLKRSYYFVPGFAKTAFRSSPRNNSANVAPLKGDGVGAGDDWVHGDGGYVFPSESGLHLQQDPATGKQSASDSKLDARLDALVQLDSDLFQAPADPVLEPPDDSITSHLGSQQQLPESMDTEASSALNVPEGRDVSEATNDTAAVEVEEAEEVLQRAYVERLRSVDAQQGAAHPGFGGGMASMAMQGRTSVDAEEPRSTPNASESTVSSAAQNASRVPEGLSEPAADAGKLDEASNEADSQSSTVEPLESSSEAEDSSSMEVEDKQPGETGTVTGGDEGNADGEADGNAGEQGSNEMDQAASSADLGADDLSLAASEGTQLEDEETHEGKGKTVASKDEAAAAVAKADESAETCEAGQCAAEGEEKSRSAAASTLGSDEVSEDYLEPVTDRSLPFTPGAERGSRQGLDEDSYTTRQEDTELGIFRPEDIE